MNIMTMAIEKKKNIMGKRENAGLQHFLFFPMMFSTPLKASLIIFKTCSIYRIRDEMHSI